MLVHAHEHFGNNSRPETAITGLALPVVRAALAVPGKVVRD